MKKLIALILATLMIFALVSCGKTEDKNTDDTNNKQETDEPKADAIASPVELLTKVWDAFGENKFSAIGGNIENVVEDAPGEYDITMKETAMAQLVITEDGLKMVDSAASLMHMMNANTFTGAAYKLADGVKAADFIKVMQDSVKGNNWICGFPEKLLTAEVTDEYVVVAFGLGDIIDVFETNLKGVYAQAKVSVENLDI